MPGTANDQSAAFTYNPAGQIDTLTKSNNAYAWNGHYNIDRPYTANGLNQLITAGTGAGALSFTYDARGNLTASGSSTYTYTSENFMKSGPNAAALTYDPLGRLYQTSKGSAATTTRFAYDGGDMIAEYNASNVLQRRYVHGPGTDNPIVWYEGTGIADKRYMIADERGSITGIVKQDGSLLAINAYDEYGIPAATNVGRFGYTGQTWLPEIGMNYYKARIYSPTLGRFMQTDPIGYGGGMNLYAYVGGDPVNFSDPSGLISNGFGDCPYTNEICVKGRRDYCRGGTTQNGVCIGGLGAGSALFDLLTARGNLLNRRVREGDIVVVGARKKNSNRFRVDRGTPPNSKACGAGGIGFTAPIDFDPQAIRDAGEAFGIAGANSNVGQYGTFDFQRVQTRAGTVFYGQYTPISNLAVGLYLEGAGYSRQDANLISNTFAFFRSSNGATLEQERFRNLAYDIVEKGLKIKCFKY